MKKRKLSNGRQAEELETFLWQHTNMTDIDLILEVAECLAEAGYSKQEWFDAKTNPPTESGDVLVFTKKGFQTILNYSVRHKAFNAFDDFMYAENAIEVTHWMPLPPDPKGE